MYIYSLSFFVVFESQTIEVSGWCSFLILHIFFGEWDFCKRGFWSWREFFSYSHVFGMNIEYHLHFNPENIFLLRIPLGTNIPYSLTNHRSFRISPLLFNWSANQMRWSTSMGRVSLLPYRFSLVFQLNHTIWAWLIKGPKPWHVGQYIFSYQRSD